MVNKLNIKINTKLYTVELSSDDPIMALKEMNKFLSLASEEVESYKEMDLYTDLDYDQYYFVPQDLRKDAHTMKYITDQIEINEGKVYRKQILPSLKLINLDNKEVTVQVKIDDLKRTVKKITNGIDKGKIKSVLLHIKGNAGDETKQLIEDQLTKHLDYAPTRTVHTKANTQDLIIEMLLFGNFSEE